MKRQVLLFFVAISFVSLLKGQELGKVIITNAYPNYPKFIVSLNGVRLTNEYAPSICFDYLEEKNYKVKILQAGSYKPINLMLNSAPNYISKYILNKDNYGNYSLILESKVLMNGNESDGHWMENQEPPVASYTTTIRAMSDKDYNDMLQAVKKENMESSKEEMAKTFFGTQNLSSAQVLGILKVFSMESTKLSFAKFAYSRTIDKQNYYKTYDAFNMSSSKKEMSEYIKNNP